MVAFIFFIYAIHFSVFGSPAKVGGILLEILYEQE